MTIAATDLTPLLCPTCQHGEIAWMKVGVRTLRTCGKCGATECALAWAMAAWDRQRKERASKVRREREGERLSRRR